MIKCDSRKVNKGDTFIALKGINGDGHRFIQDAINRGASKIVCLLYTSPSPRDRG